LKPPSSSVAVSGSGALLTHQIRAIEAKTGIFSTTRRKKIGQKPCIASV
jgi:hypothetical protein